MFKFAKTYLHAKYRWNLRAGFGEYDSAELDGMRMFLVCNSFYLKKRM